MEVTCSNSPWPKLTAHGTTTVPMLQHSQRGAAAAAGKGAQCNLRRSARRRASCVVPHRQIRCLAPIRSRDAAARRRRRAGGAGASLDDRRGRHPRPARPAVLRAACAPVARQRASPAHCRADGMGVCTAAPCAGVLTESTNCSAGQQCCLIDWGPCVSDGRLACHCDFLQLPRA